MLIEHIAELSEITPLAEEVVSTYDETKERMRHREWCVDKIPAEYHWRALELASSNRAASSNTPRKRRPKVKRCL